MPGEYRHELQIKRDGCEVLW